MWLDSLHLFAQAQSDINQYINNGADIATNIATSWDNQWSDLLQNSTTNWYKSLTDVGRFFAVGTFLFFMVQWLRDAIYDEYSRPLTELIWPFVVVALLTTPIENGTALSNLTLGVRNYINAINFDVVEVSNDTNEQNYYQQALNMSVAEDIAGSFLRPCQSLTGDLQTGCFVEANKKIEDLLTVYREKYKDKGWISRLQEKVSRILQDSNQEFAFNSLLGSTVQTTIKNFFISLQFAFQNLIEATMLLIAALGPLAVGGSLLPVAGKPIFAWLTGFLSIGIAKISFNIIAVLTATVIVKASDSNPTMDQDLMWFIIFMGILAPLLSLGVAAAGGFAVFGAISSASTWVRDRI
ncbi:MAG: hypothetical protein DSM106950_14095 [Stigonema ocellatum SAG 48.90 = DSM 106950]|nr:hypothetical protein [Stigonema ocellatum SAG 48.90 = DSM 106950]